MITLNRAGKKRSLQFKNKLRQRFIEQCESYIGIPYSKRLFKPGDKHHDAPLYLDCCALVSRAVTDLRLDFGFALGRGNQAYQYDTCPIDLEQHELQPGDLIFSSADYFNPVHVQKHDMVHIEVFLGGGPNNERSIGSRHQVGEVRIHDSFRFVSKSYGNIKYYFKSLDTWLDGVCRSHCSIHTWQPQRFSIVQGNNHELIQRYLERGMTNMIDGQQNFDKIRFRWTSQPKEIDYKRFVIGQHVVNHFSNSHLLTNKIKLHKLLTGLNEAMLSGKVTSSIFKTVSEFSPEQYSLEDKPELIDFFIKSKKSKDQWVVRNVTQHNMVEEEKQGLSLIGDIVYYKNGILSKVSKKLRDKINKAVTTGIKQDEESKIGAAAAAECSFQTPVKKAKTSKLNTTSRKTT